MIKIILKIILFYLALTFILGVDVLPIAIISGLALGIFTLLAYTFIRILIFIFPIKSEKNQREVTCGDDDRKSNKTSNKVPTFFYYLLALDGHHGHHHH